jgi:tRNA-Thr(GGU) m(6)t(6)A37 methyltransferase TsaA
MIRPAVNEAVVNETLESLDVFVGEWSVTSSFSPERADGPRTRTTFEWLPGRRFLVQRWEIEHPDVPDGVAIIGFDAEKATLLQFYFDARGVARIYEMTLADAVWTLSRKARPPDFSQRFTGTFDPGGDTIVGAWEISHDGATWEHDFDLVYERVYASRPYAVRPIGVVRSTPHEVGDAPNQAFEGAPGALLEIDPTLASALHRVEPGDELIVVTWLHLADRGIRQTHPTGDIRIPLTGVFRTRSPDRPNPIGIHRVTVTAREGAAALRVGALEAIDGTPIIDLKIAMRDS